MLRFWVQWPCRIQVVVTVRLISVLWIDINAAAAGQAFRQLVACSRDGTRPGCPDEYWGDSDALMSGSRS